MEEKREKREGRKKTGGYFPDCLRGEKREKWKERKRREGYLFHTWDDDDDKLTVGYGRKKKP